MSVEPKTAPYIIIVLIVLFGIMGCLCCVVVWELFKDRRNRANLNSGYVPLVPVARPPPFRFRYNSSKGKCERERNYQREPIEL